MAAPRLSPRALAGQLAALPVTVEAAAALAFGVHLRSYPGGVRPSGVLYLSGQGCIGTGEHVAFSFEAQEQFAADVHAGLGRTRGSATVAELSARNAGMHPYARATWEAALIELALRQAGVALSEWTGVGAREIRYVTSFAACPDPAAVVRALRSENPGAGSAEFKVDVDPAWSGTAIEALARTGAVAILDFKGRGDAALAEALAARFSTALLEDPPAGAALPARRVIHDAPIGDAAAAERAVAGGFGLNVKAARMGGPLAALAALDAGARAGVPHYIGGMFEVGVGRRQARALAALYTPDAPNDLAPIR